jgi:tellurite methyltransferase
VGHSTGNQPSPFVLRAASEIARGARGSLFDKGTSSSTSQRALDLAMGSGRHALPLARLGFQTFGVDRDFAQVAAAARQAKDEGLMLRLWVADLDSARLPRLAFDLVVCTRYLDRSRATSWAATLRTGGILLFETFTTAQLGHGRGPKSPDHLLRSGELAGLFPMLTTIWYEEVDEPDAVARLIARRDISYSPAPISDANDRLSA